ncbi:MAG TPA: ABC transporter substrate-binding protein [Paracoccus sp. (in: a-proteobacteria)]|uniref:ABC transporter substrate-binding protein n=1 Tax=uncultured Paracoccus sp. TaxID=189685 RepID=UPI0026059696|nr:ABC transporter substrate-binding protein [uncultured Paracoccus sp.]HMQ41908.1 ABC transporter substrate-binding protein [Paracoccus sp. (in: a-proteobacteria)]HMR37211.1 ABC transporter substrate-binding protein [Paracoccus sp. (in: a-proteobacteria)]
MTAFAKIACAGAVASFAGATWAEELEVTHWWTSGGEAAAVAEFAKAFDATGNKWVDGAIAGSGSTARPIMISRITGGDPMAATQFNHGRQAEELVEAGLMRPITEVAEAEGWANIVATPGLLDSCTLDGELYCVPVNIHSWQWLWLSNKAFEEAGVPVPTTWDEFVAAGPALEAAGKVPMALGKQPWQAMGAFKVLVLNLGGPELYTKVFGDKDTDAAAGPEMAAVWKAADDMRKLAVGSNVQEWNQATSMVINGQAGGQIMGDWAQGEFQVAGQVAGTDYTCLPGLGAQTYLSTAGDAIYFPLLRDEGKSAAQLELASVLFSPEAQLAFNTKKGSLPVRNDLDLSTANDCMRKGLEILAEGNIVPDTDQLISPDTNTQLQDLMIQFISDMNMTPDAAQARFVEIIGDAD